MTTHETLTILDALLGAVIAQGDLVCELADSKDARVVEMSDFIDKAQDLIAAAKEREGMR